MKSQHKCFKNVIPSFPTNFCACLHCVFLSRYCRTRERAQPFYADQACFIPDALSKALSVIAAGLWDQENLSVLRGKKILDVKGMLLAKELLKSWWKCWVSYVKNLSKILITRKGNKQSFGCEISYCKAFTEEPLEKRYKGILLLVRLFSLFGCEHGPSVRETLSSQISVCAGIL